MYYRPSLLYICACLALHHHRLLISSRHPILQVLESLTSLSEFASNPHYCAKIIGSESSPGYMCKGKNAKLWPLLWITEQSAFLASQLHHDKHEAASDDLGLHQNFSTQEVLTIIHSTVACFALCSASSSLMNPFPLHRSPVAVGHGCYCLALLRSVPAAAYIVLVTVLRYHLFIWSVFSPKLLYESMHLLLTAGVCLFFITMEQSPSSSKS